MAIYTSEQRNSGVTRESSTWKLVDGVMYVVYICCGYAETG
jgi:hypothetical protein